MMNAILTLKSMLTCVRMFLTFYTFKCFINTFYARGLLDLLTNDGILI